MSGSSSTLTAQTETATIRSLLVGSVPEYTQAETSPQPEFCQAMFFYYSCGCRTPEPFFCCQPRTNSHGPNPCQHKNPAVVVSMLPVPCSLKIGKSEACAAEDPGAKEFVREVDTAERLDLMVLDQWSQGDVQTCLPAKVRVASTIQDVVLGSPQDGNRTRSKKTFSATAAPFVPGLKIFEKVVPISQSIPKAPETSCVSRTDIKKDEDAASSEHSVETTHPKKEPELEQEGQQNELKPEPEHRREQEPQNRPEPAPEGHKHEKQHIENQQEELLNSGASGPSDMTHPQEFECDDIDILDEFYDVNSSNLTHSETINMEKSESAEGSYNDLYKFWAMGNDADENSKPTKTHTWGILSLFGLFGGCGV